MKIREATSFDKNLVLKFCKNTFSWGDYIDKVWSSWLDEGNLFLFEKESLLEFVMHFIFKIKFGLKVFVLIQIFKDKRLHQSL